MYKVHHHSKQHGMATMAITLILLFIGTLVALYTAKTSIKEQQISANQYRADQSLSNANAALDVGVAKLGQADGKICDKELEDTAGTGYTCPGRVMCTITTSDPTKCTFAYKESAVLSIDHSLDENYIGEDDILSIGASEMYFAFVKADGTELEYIPVKGDIGERLINDGDGVTPVYFADIKIYGIGHSDDDTGRRVVSLEMDSSNIFGDPGLGASAFPLISKATSGANASITIINRFDNRTIWTGDELVISGSTNTYVLDDGLGWNCNDIRNHLNCVTSDMHAGEPLYTMPASDGVNTINADIIDADSNLANLDSDPNLDTDEFFVNFFGKTKEIMRDLAKNEGLYIEVDNKGDLIGTDLDGNPMNWASIADYNTPLVWIQAPSGGDYTPGGGEMDQIGTEEDPMVLIVDGNLKIGGTGDAGLILVGALYVTGTWDSSANPVVQGMVIVETESDLGGAGTPTLIYDAALFGGQMGPPPGTIAGTTPGTWKDWE